MAYTTQLAYMVHAARRIHGGRYRDYLVLNLNDGQALRGVAKRRLARVSTLLGSLGSIRWGRRLATSDE